MSNSESNNSGNKIIRNAEFHRNPDLTLFIKEVEKYPILYNAEQKNFIGLQKKTQVWSRLSRKFHLNAKQRFRSLRDRYVREKKKVDQKLITSKTIDYPTWQYFSYLTFLDKYLRKSNKNNVEEQKNNSINDDNLKEEETENINDDDDDKEKSIKTENSDKNCSIAEEAIEYEYFDNYNIDLNNDINLIDDNDNGIKTNIEEINLENKCGQIYFENGKFIFLCDFCERIFNNIEIYMEHILNYHKSNEINMNNIIGNLKQDPDKQHNNILYDSNKIDSTVKEEEDINTKIQDPLSVQNYKFEVEYLDENNSNNNNNDSQDKLSIHSDSNNNNNNNNNNKKNNSNKKCNSTKSTIYYEKPPKILNDNNEYPCTQCENKYNIYKSLRDHFRINHTKLCSYCSVRCNIKLLEIHLKEQHPNEENYAITTNLNNQRKSIDDKKIMDLNSNKEYNETKEIINNNEPVRMQNSDGRYICTLCDDITYARFENIKKHYRSVHLAIKKSRHYCSECDKNYYSSFQLRAHMNIHKGLRPYKCHICSADFTHPQYLNFHIRIHLNDKRYPCKYCGKKFIRPYERVYHERANHTNEKLYQCDDCGKTFIKNSQLTRHKNIKHNPNYIRPLYECDICINSFTTKESMLKHKLIHEGKKPFECDICGSKFRAQHNLNVHKKIHSNVKNYVCKICNKRFAQGPGLYSHMKSHGIALSSNKVSNLI